MKNFENLFRPKIGEYVDEGMEEVETSALNDLGLSWEDLKGKRVLDIGAGSGDMEAVAKKKGIEMIALDPNRSSWENDRLEGSGKGLPDVPYVRGVGENLPFADESFDIVIARASTPILATSKEEVIKVINEANRVLKEGAKFYFGPGNLSANIFSEEELFTPEEDENFTTKQRVERIGNKANEFLATINANIKQEPIPGNSGKYESNTYYVMEKFTSD